jgi:DNA-binding CsgD family transcriptional regulator
MPSERQANRTRRELMALCHRGFDVPRYVDAAVGLLHRSVPVDGGCWVTMDPATLLVTGHIAQGPFQPEDIPRLAHHEYLEDDVNQFPTLARQGPTASILREATGGDPQRSSRYRELLMPKGCEDELRTAFVEGTRCWGAAAMYRDSARSRFEPADRELLADVASLIAAGLRRAILIAGLATDEALDGPGLVLLRDNNAVEGITPAAERWLAALSATGAPRTLPAVVYAVASRARQIGRGGESASTGVTRARIQAPFGQWLVLHGSLIQTPSGTRTAVIVEPARPLEVAPLILEAYRLTEREREIVRRILEGLSTKEIAKMLYLSPYTVQDHLKAIFEKVGVRSRRELLAQVFFQSYAPRIGRADNLATDGWFEGEQAQRTNAAELRRGHLARVTRTGLSQPL